MIAGTCAGAGKSTLMRGLRDVIEGGRDSVVEVTEDAVWGERRADDAPVDRSTAWPEFRRLLHDRTERPDPTEVLEAFDAMRRRIADRSWWLQDWTWPDLLALACGSDGDPVTWSRALRREADDLDPMVLWLDVDPTVALRRAEHERGSAWLARHAAEFADGHRSEGDIAAVALGRIEEARVRHRILEETGWRTIDLDANNNDEAVLAAAAEALEWDHR
jgi:thymidylate kinase